MDSCDVLVVGGGPAGSTCARTLRDAGADVIVMDKATFPRDKVCAGWITPQVVTDLGLDLDEYAYNRTLQPIRGFRAGVIGRQHDVTTAYDRIVSYGIRRCEFDHYLLLRSRARRREGEPIGRIRRVGEEWIVNESVTTRMLVGAGGHFCPVARLLNRDMQDGSTLEATPARKDGAPVVAAQEAEFPIDANAAAFAVDPETPELYFSADLNGYGWCFRKQNYLNVGLGLLDRHLCSITTRGFVEYLKATGRIPPAMSWRWRGHAYLLAEPRVRQAIDDGVLLIGDAAGLAYVQSGEGIRPAIESGLMAADTILNAGGTYARDRLARYETALGIRFGSSTYPRSSIVPPALASAVAVGLMRVPAFVRHVVLDRWFLRAAAPALV